MQTRETVVGVFDDRDDAEDAINALKEAGFRADEIGVAARDRDTAGVLAEDTGTQAGTGAATGALTGGLLGGVAGWLVGIGALAIPGIGPLVAAGPLAAALGGAALGATGGGLIGALTGAGVPEDEAKWYDERVRGGGILVSVNAHGRYDEARSIMREHGGHDFTSATSTASRSWDETAPEFRSRYESRYGTGRGWEDVERSHRFGYEAYGTARQGGARTDWQTAEAEVRKEWDLRGYGPWDEHREDVRRGYDYGRGRTRFRDLGLREPETGAAVGGTALGSPPGPLAGGASGDDAMEADRERRRGGGAEPV